MNPSISSRQSQVLKSATVAMRSIEELSGTVRISLVANSADGISLARTVIESTFNRLAFFHGLAIEPARVTGSNFSSANPQPGHNILSPGAGYIHFEGFAPKITVGISSATIQSELEQSGPPGEKSFGHLRSARLSVGPVEEFMHLYAILLIFFKDSQKKVDGFAVSIDPSVQQTRSPKYPEALETVYTRLRNC